MWTNRIDYLVNHDMRSPMSFLYSGPSYERVMDSLIHRAKEILLEYRRGDFTVPTSKLYPFQWNWDSGFTCLGLSHFNPKLAMLEMQSLFSGQWENGMIPHIIFHNENETTYFPNHDFWNASVNSGAPGKPKTSGISQPPVHGFVFERLWNMHRDNPEMAAFVRDMFPKVVKSQLFWYETRDIHREGLVFIFHPWESGRDNSPIWDESCK